MKIVAIIVLTVSLLSASTASAYTIGGGSASSPAISIVKNKPRFPKACAKKKAHKKVWKKCCSKKVKMKRGGGSVPLPSLP